MAELVTDSMKVYGTNFLVKCIPKSVRQQQDGRLQVEYENTFDGSTKTDEYDTVMTAIGSFVQNTNCFVFVLLLQKCVETLIHINIQYQYISTTTCTYLGCFSGREACTRDMGLEDIGVKVDSKSRCIIGGHSDFETSSVPHIYAIGDVLKVGTLFVRLYLYNMQNNVEFIYYLCLNNCQALKGDFVNVF